MKRLFIIVIIAIVLVSTGMIFFRHTRDSFEETNTIPAEQEADDTAYSQRYENKEMKIALRYPEGYVVDESYAYQLAPGKEIRGVKFVIPKIYTNGTNLSNDSYIAVESLSGISSCSAKLFLDGIHPATLITDAGVAYSLVESSNAGAGNRYEETVYAVSSTNPCIAVRYLVHFTAIQNYEPGTIKEFDKETLLREFDAIRHTLVIY